MRIISTDEIKKNIKEMCIEANYELSADVKDKLYDKAQKEESILGKLRYCSQRPYSNLSGYRNGSCLFENRPGCTF